MTFIEHNNRKRANKFAEYITSPVLRQYLADKVRRYCGTEVSVFDGAAGSGQLEQFIKPSEFHAVEIQAEACEALKKNYKNATVHNMSFFQYQEDILVEAIAMNPPYSIKFKDLPEEDRRAIQAEFPWKKSGVVDDIFLLKSLKYTKRYAFYIMFPGIAYRSAEKKMREVIGNKLIELSVIQNGFDDTNISVLFIVIDKQKTDKNCVREIYDCKVSNQLKVDNWKINSDLWETAKIEQEKEKIDIDTINTELDRRALAHLENHLKSQLHVIQAFEANIDYLGFISKCYDILANYEVLYNFGAST